MHSVSHLIKPHKASPVVGKQQLLRWCWVQQTAGEQTLNSFLSQDFDAAIGGADLQGRTSFCRLCTAATESASFFFKQKTAYEVLA